jgi:hypothetical protein
MASINALNVKSFTVQPVQVSGLQLRLERMSPWFQMQSELSTIKFYVLVGFLSIPQCLQILMRLICANSIYIKQSLCKPWTQPVSRFPTAQLQELFSLKLCLTRN